MDWKSNRQTNLITEKQLVEKSACKVYAEDRHLFNGLRFENVLALTLNGDCCLRCPSCYIVTS